MAGTYLKLKSYVVSILNLLKLDILSSDIEENEIRATKNAKKLYQSCFNEG